MLKISNIYLGKCTDCQNASAGGFGIILACHCPCTRSQRGNDLPCSNIKSAPSNHKIHFLDTPNLEIPDYKVMDFKKVLDLIQKWQKEGDVVVISEHAKSRAASLALLWLALRDRTISRSSYSAARADFVRIYPQYTPWPGMVIFLNQEWDSFLA